MKIERIKLLNVPVDIINMKDSVFFAQQKILKSQQISILAVNPEKIIVSRQDPFLLNALCETELLIPDGIGAVILARFKGAKGISRVPGAELMPELCSMASKQGYPIFLFGGSEIVNKTLCSVLLESYPGIKIAGRRNGYIDESQHTKLVDEINESGAKILFVALGSPKQEKFIIQYRDKLKVNVLQGVGGTFDVLTGNVKRAPRIWRKLYLEWLYRLLSQPSRIFRQIALPKFILLAIVDFLFTGKRS